MLPTIINTANVCEINQKAVLACLRFHDQFSRAELARMFGVHAGTISRVVNPLMEAGVISSPGIKNHKKVGKPPTILEINLRFASVVGVEVNEMNIRLILTDFKGTVLARRIVSTRAIFSDFENAFPRVVASFIEDHAKGNGCGPLRGIGIGVSGIVLPDTGCVVSGFLPHGLKINSIVGEYLGIPVYSDNDANLAAVGEHTFGIGRGMRNVVCLLDRGWVGAGIFLNGELYRGTNSAAGELTAGVLPAHVSADSTPPFIDSYSLEHRIQEKDYAISVDGFASRVDMIKELAGRAEAGDDAAREIIEAEAADYARAFRRLANLFDPELLILCGDMTSAGDIFRRAMSRNFHGNEYNFGKCMESFKPPRLEFSPVGEDCVTMGAVAAMIERIDQSVVQNGK